MKSRTCPRLSERRRYGSREPELRAVADVTAGAATLETAGAGSFRCRCHAFVRRSPASTLERAVLTLVALV